MNTPRINIIAAIGQNRELGKNNDLIWRIADDLKRVKEITMGHPIIMGQNTFQSIGKPLPGRTNIVLTKDTSYCPDGCVMAHSLDEALEKAYALDNEEIFMFGGARVYHDTINLAQRLYLTLIQDTDKDADVFFPEYTEFTHIITSEERQQGNLAYQWLTLEKK